MIFPYAQPPANYPVHPTQLYEALFNFSMFFVLRSIRPKLKRNGLTFSLYLIVAGSERFLIEFIRVNPEWALGLTGAQFTSIFLILAGIIVAFISQPKENKK